MKNMKTWLKTFHKNWWLWLLVWFVIGLWASQKVKYLGDETAHAETINHLLAGDWQALRSRSVLPGFHVVIASGAKLIDLLGFDIKFSTKTFRTIHFVLSFLLLTALIPSAKSIAGPLAPRRLGQVVLFPYLLAIQLVLYTDAISAFLVLVGFGLMHQQRRVLAGLIMAYAVFTRQQNIVWAVALLLFDIFRDYKYETFKHLVLHGFKTMIKNWAMVLVGVAFGAYWIINGGITPNGNRIHSVTFNFEIIYYFFFSLGIFLIPSTLGNWQNHKAKIQKYYHRYQYLIIPAILALIIVFYATFGPLHNWQRDTMSLRNILLQDFIASPTSKLIFLCFVLWGILTMLLTEFKTNIWKILLPVFGILSIAPNIVVAPRYMAIPLLLFVYLRKPDDEKTEKSQTLYFAVLAAAVIYGIIFKDKFLWP